MNLYDAINKAIDLFENWTKEKPAIIYLGYLDYKKYFDDGNDEIVQGVDISEDTGNPNGIIVGIDNSNDIVPATIIEEMINYELETGLQPNEITISKDFYDIFCKQFEYEEPVFVVPIESIVKVDEKQEDDIACRYNVCLKEIYKAAIAKCILTAEEDLVEEEKSDKDKYLDWLLNDDDEILDAMQYVEDHGKKIDEDFNEFLTDFAIDKWEQNSKRYNDYY